MKLLNGILIFSLVILAGCGTSEIEKFQGEATAFAADNKIDEREYKSLIEKIKSTTDERLKNQFLAPDRQVDESKVTDYLRKFFAAKKQPVEIWQSGNQPAGVSKFNIDVYIENSVSMDGYVKGATDFETAIYNLLGDIKISGLCDSLNLNYINKDITFTKTNALAPEIQDFIEKLEPSTFQQRGGKRGVSDLKNILKTVIEKVDERNAAILISDFVFSPGSGVNAQDYLNNQTVGIKIDFAEKLKVFDLAAVFLQMQSNFDGDYYDKTNQKISLKSKRPYYIWIFGSRAQIKYILDKKIVEGIKGGYQNRIIFTSLKEPSVLEYKILLNPKIGDFRLPNGAKGEITDAVASREPSTKGIFEFSVVVNFSGAMQDASYFLDPSNYRLSNNNYSLAVEPISGANPATDGFTHKLKLQTKELKAGEETLKIEVIGKVPIWVANSSSTDDSAIASDDSEKQKTFGLKHLADGISDAFYPPADNNSMSQISISIKK